ncbi:MAG TPA: hypothetical protein VIV60_04795 [Polyangiaceae bacterium]
MKWDEDLARRGAEAQAAQYDIEHTQSRSRERSLRRNDVVLTRVVVRERTDYSATIRSLAGTLISEHQRDINRHRREPANTDAVAAWRLVLRTNDRDELFERVRIAARYTFQVPN